MCPICQPALRRPGHKPSQDGILREGRECATGGGERLEPELELELPDMCRVLGKAIPFPRLGEGAHQPGFIGRRVPDAGTAQRPPSAPTLVG